MLSLIVSVEAELAISLVPASSPQKMLLLIRGLLPLLFMASPADAVLAVFPLTVTFFRVGLLDWLARPPPAPAWLPLMVTLVSTGLLPLLL